LRTRRSAEPRVGVGFDGNPVASPRSGRYLLRIA